MEKNYISPPSSPSSNGSTPSSDSQSLFDSNQVSIYYNFKIIFLYINYLFKKVLSKLLPKLNNKNTMCNDNIAIAPRPTDTSQKVPKLKILPAPIKSTFNKDVSSKNNNTLIHNNCKYQILYN